MKAEILSKREKSPERDTPLLLPKSGPNEIDRKHDEKARQNSEGTSNIKRRKRDPSFGFKLPKQLPANQVSAQNEKQIDAGPTVMPDGIQSGNVGLALEMPEDDDQNSERAERV